MNWKLHAMDRHLDLSSRRTVILTLFCVGYVLGFFPLYALMGAGTAALSVIPVMVAAWLYEFKAGLVAGLLAFPVNTLLLNWVGQEPGGWLAVIWSGGGPGTLAIIVMGITLGHFSQVSRRLKTEIAERQQAEEQLLEYQSQLKSLTSALSLATEREQLRLANELHDQISQSLVVSNMKLEELQESFQSSDQVQLAQEIKTLVQQMLQDTQSLTFEMSPMMLYDLGLEPAVYWLAEQAERKYGFRCQVQDDGQSKRLDRDRRVVLSQAVRELLANVARHAKASQVKIVLWKQGQQIGIRVEDNGVGFDPSSIRSSSSPKGPLGLFNIREHMDLINGTLNLESEQSEGTRVTLMAPLTPETEDAT